MLKILLLTSALFSANVFAQVPDPKAAFAKTMAAGQNKWTFQDAKLTIVRDGKPTVNKCSITNPAYPLTLKGALPSVSLSIGDMKCDVEAREITMLKSIFWELTYAAYHIPAGTSDPNQFRLVFERKVPTYPRVVAKSVKSLNALTRDNLVYLDMVATEVEQLWGMDSVYYFAEFSIERGENGQPAKLTMSLTIDEVGKKPAKTELTLTADLIPAK